MLRDLHIGVRFQYGRIRLFDILTSCPALKLIAQNIAELIVNLAT